MAYVRSAETSSKIYPTREVSGWLEAYTFNTKTFTKLAITPFIYYTNYIISKPLIILLHCL